MKKQLLVVMGVLALLAVAESKAIVGIPLSEGNKKLSSEHGAYIKDAKKVTMLGFSSNVTNGSILRLSVGDKIGLVTSSVSSLSQAYVNSDYFKDTTKEDVEPASNEWMGGGGYQVFTVVKRLPIHGSTIVIINRSLSKETTKKVYALPKISSLLSGKK